MSSASFSFPQHRLGKLMKQAGGKTVAEAVNDAARGVEKLKPPCLETIDEHLAVIDERMKAFLAAEDKGAAGRELYQAVNSLIGLAGAIGIEAVDKAAFSLCDLIDQMTRLDRWDTAALAVHVQSLHLLRSTDAGSEAASQTILAGLKKVRDKIVSGDTPRPGGAAG